jgi:hypothetical protein
MIPDDIPTVQPQNPPAPAPETTCPLCGRSWPFEARQSGMLDMVALAQAVLADLQAAIEAEVVP